MRVDQRPRFSSARQEWRTPDHLYRDLDAEFGFTLDPCPFLELGDRFELRPDGLSSSWEGERVFLNPPYDDLVTWCRKAAEESVLVVALLPARTGTAWFHEWVLPWADEIRFLRGRLRFGRTEDNPGKGEHNAPFDSMIVVWRPRKGSSTQEPKA